MIIHGSVWAEDTKPAQENQLQFCPTHPKPGSYLFTGTFKAATETWRYLLKFLS